MRESSDSPTLLAVASLFVVGRDAPLDFVVGGRLAVELAVGSLFGQRQIAAGGRLTRLMLGGGAHKQEHVAPSDHRVC